MEIWRHNWMGINGNQSSSDCSWSSPQGKLSTAAGCPQRWCCLHHWNSSRPCWIKPWAAWSDPSAAPAVLWRLGCGTSWGPSSTKLFCDSVTEPCSPAWLSAPAMHFLNLEFCSGFDTSDSPWQIFFSLWLHCHDYLCVHLREINPVSEEMSSCKLRVWILGGW